jgi:hypothetical protein
MAGTASLRSDPPRRPGSAADERRAALAVSRRGERGERCRGCRARAAAGRGYQENWALDAHFSGGLSPEISGSSFALAAPTGVAASLGRLQEFAVLKAAFAAQ